LHRAAGGAGEPPSARRPKACFTTFSASIAFDPKNLALNTDTMSSESIPHPPSAGDPEWLALVRAQVENLRYGVVQLVVHDGRVTQIERTEKTRLPSQIDSAAKSR
jgi:hypothetical protein